MEKTEKTIDKYFEEMNRRMLEECYIPSSVLLLDTSTCNKNIAKICFDNFHKKMCLFLGIKYEG